MVTTTESRRPSLPPEGQLYAEAEQALGRGDFRRLRRLHAALRQRGRLDEARRLAGHLDLPVRAAALASGFVLALVLARLAL